MSTKQHRHFFPFKLGDVKPRGWIRAQMLRDLEKGFVGHLDKIVPGLVVEDDIYGKDRLTAQVRRKDLGIATRDEDWEVQFGAARPDSPCASFGIDTPEKTIHLVGIPQLD